MKQSTITDGSIASGFRPQLTLRPGERPSVAAYLRITTDLLKILTQEPDATDLVQDELLPLPVHDQFNDPVNPTGLPRIFISFLKQEGASVDATKDAYSDERDKTWYEIATKLTYSFGVAVQADNEPAVIRLMDYLHVLLLEYAQIAFQHVQMTKFVVTNPAPVEKVDKSTTHFASILPISYTVDLTTKIRSQEPTLNTVEIK